MTSIKQIFFKSNNRLKKNQRLDKLSLVNFNLFYNKMKLFKIDWHI